MIRSVKISLFAVGLAIQFAGPAYSAGALLTTPSMGNYVYETHMPSAGAAVDKAMAFCRGRYGGGCSVLKTWSSGCIAVVHATGSNHSGWAVSGNLDESVSSAMANCTKYGQPCVVQVSKCD
jgi:Domain of unknown function (DUF4189)